VVFLHPAVRLRFAVSTYRTSQEGRELERRTCYDSLPFHSRRLGNHLDAQPCTDRSAVTQQIQAESCYLRNELLQTEERISPGRERSIWRFKAEWSERHQQGLVSISWASPRLVYSLIIFAIGAHHLFFFAICRHAGVHPPVGSGPPAQHRLSRETHTQSPVQGLTERTPTQPRNPPDANAYTHTQELAPGGKSTVQGAPSVSIYSNAEVQAKNGA
jgi:hypothetical protein